MHLTFYPSGEPLTHAAVTPTCVPDGSLIQLGLRNDGDAVFSGFLVFFLAPTDGTPREPRRVSVQIPPQSVSRVIFFDRKEIRRRRDVLVLRVLDAEENCLCERRLLCCKEKRLILFDPGLRVQPVLRAGELFARVFAARYAKDVRLHCEGGDFERNGFDLCAGETAFVPLHVTSAAAAERVTVTSEFDRRKKRRTHC